MPKIAIVQCEVSEADVARNLASLEDSLTLIEDDTDVVVFPELFLSGFVTRDELPVCALSSDSDILRRIERLSRQHGVAVSVGFAEQYENAYFNSVAWIQAGHRSQVYRKNYLWLCDAEIYVAGDESVVVPYNGMNFGLAICFDIEFPELGRAAAKKGVEALLVSNGNMEPYGHMHRIAAQARAIENHCYVVMCNRVGSARGREFVGDSLVVDPLGQIIASLGQEPGIGYAILDHEQISRSKAAYCYLDHIDKSLRSTTAGNTSKT